MDIEDGFVTSVFTDDFQQFDLREDISQRIDWLVDRPTPVTHSKLTSDGFIAAKVFENVARLEQLQDLWIESFAEYSDKEVHPLRQLHNLQELTFKETLLTPSACRESLKIPSLKKLGILKMTNEMRTELQSLRSEVVVYGHGNFEP